MIRFANVFKTYPNGQQALQDINLVLKTGEMAFLTGHSGAGKSTLLKLLIKMETVTRGNIFLDNYHLDQFRQRHIPYLRRQVSMIFQDPQLLYNKTVFENIALPLIISRFHPVEIEKRVRAALNKVGLLGKEYLSPYALSSGEQQRVGIARAIVNTPRYLLADEPTGNLDPELSLDIMRLFEAFNKAGVTVLIATHNLSLAATLKHRIITLKKGMIVGDTAHGHPRAPYYETETL